MGKQILPRTTSPIHRLIGITLACWLALAGGLIHAQPVQAATLTINPNDSSPTAVVGTYWEQVYSASGGTAPYTCSMDGTIPGLNFNTSTCTLSGTPTDFGSYTGTITFSDSDTPKNSGSLTLNFTVEAETTTTLSILSGHPDGINTYMVGFPVWVHATVRYSFPHLSGEQPTGTVTITGTGGPTCSIDLENGEGECALVFSTDGDKTITATYPKTDFARASSDSESKNIQPLDLTPILSAGDNHTCYLGSDGIMSCWGLEGGYEPPDDDTDGDTTPDPRGPYTKISAGGHHTCGLKTDGKIECWGDNTAVTVSVPDKIFVDVSAGDEYVCAIDNINQLHCWGNIAADDPLLTDLPTSKVTAVSAGTNFTCAIQRNNDQPICWGTDAVSPDTVEVNQLAVGNTHTCAIKSDDTLACWGLSVSPPTGTFKRIASGSDYSCAQKKTNDELVCWGTNAPTVDTISSFTHFDSGFLHTCALRPDGSTNTLSCWGTNTYGQAPRIVVEPAAFADAYLRNDKLFSQSLTASGGNEPYTIALVSGSSLPAGLTLTDGIIAGTPTTPGDYSFTLSAAETFSGSSLPLELTPGRVTYETTVYDPATTTTLNPLSGPVDAGNAVTATATVTRVSATQPPLTGSVEIASTDGEGTCQAEVVNGTAQCNLYFSTPGEKTVTATFEENDAFAASPPDSKTITINPVTINPAVDAGGYFSCSINSGGFLTCWGKDTDEQVSTHPSTGGFKQVSLGESYACALGLNRQVECWGWDGYGLTDDENYKDFLTVQEVNSGNAHSCVLLDTGLVECWGNNGFKQLNVPSPGIGNKFTQVDAGANHTCGLVSNGEIKCWGDNSTGQTDVLPGSYTKVSAGGNSSCALKIDGSVTCWGGLTASGGPYSDLTVGGDFACGLKSDGSVTCWGGLVETLPGPFSQIAAGANHACGILDNRRMQCWGDNSQDQAPVIAINPDLLGPIDVGTTWSGQVNADGGRFGAVYAYSVSSGALPSGLALDSNEGNITGTLTQAGVFNFTVLAQETGYEPAIAATRAYEVTVRGLVDASIDSALPANVMVGQPVLVAFSVHAQTGNDMGAEPTGTVTVTADDNECIVDLVDGEGNCTMLFATPGTKTLSITYPDDDDLYQPGQSSAEYEVIPFSQPVQIRTSATRTYVHHPDGSVGCLGGTCESETLPGLFTRFEVGASFACGLQYDENAKGGIVCHEDDGATAPEFNDGPYIDLSVGVNHACALKLDGTVECQGDDTDGQASPTAGSYAALSAGGDHTCALNTLGEATCWGAFDTAPAGPFETLTSGDHHTCGLKSDGAVECWGVDDAGQSTVPSSPATFAQIAAGGNQTCGLDAEGHAFCWGDDEYGQSSPAYGHFIAVDTADDHTCALRDLNGMLGFTCWGAVGDEAPQYEYTQMTIPSWPALKPFEHDFGTKGRPTPLDASIVAGRLPPGLCMDAECGPGTVVEPLPGYTPQVLGPAGMMLSGTPTIPGEYEFLIRWTDSTGYPLVMEQPYWLTVTGGDLKVELTQLTPFDPLPGMEYWFKVDVTNQTDLPVPGSVLTVHLPVGLQMTELIGSDCELTESILTCHLDDVPGNSTITFYIGGLITQNDGTTLQFTAQVDSTDEEWPELNSDDNSDALSVPVVSRTIVSVQDYEWLPDDAAAPNGQKFHFVAGGPGLIHFTEPYTDLPPHRDVWVSFDLYIIGGWLGNNTPDGEPSRFTFGHANQLLDTTFSNDPAYNQAYPRNWPSGKNSAQSGAVGIDELGYEDEIDGSPVPDARYPLSFQFPHDGDELELIFTGIDVPDGAAWGIDNLTLEVGFGVRQVFLPLITMSR